LYGYKGKILQVDLKNKKSRILRPKTSLLRKFLGGSGLGAKLLYDNLKPETDPYAPENLVIFMTGPTAGTIIPTSARHAMVTKSPLTGLMVESWAGGRFGHEIKLAGYDGFMVSGRSEKPIYLWIDNENVEFRDASSLWGKTTHETDTGIKEDVGNPDAIVACIGPAGENLVRFACVINDRYSASGRGGVGAVFGSKNLKGVAVYGTNTMQVANMESLLELVREANDRIKKDALTGETFPMVGTLGNVWPVNEAGVFPTRNFKFGVFKQIEKITGETMREDYVFKDISCYTCPVACQKRTRLDKGKYSGTISEGPEYESMWVFSAHCGNDDLETVIRANHLCNLYGLDTISTGGVIGFAMECNEKNLLKKKNLVDQDLVFGNSDAIIDNINLIAYRKGIGNLLAEGVKRVAQKLHAEDFGMHVKGLELPAYDPRGLMGMGLAYATSNRGACHNRAWVVGMELYTDMDRFTTKGKAKLCKDMQDYTAVKDSLIMCHFLFSPNNPVLDLEWVVKMLKALTGNEYTNNELLKIGERNWNLVRAFNIRAGLTRKDDTLPNRLLKETLPYGPSKGYVVKLKEMLDEYYVLRKWNKKGIPREEKLIELGLSEIATDLRNMEEKKDDF